MTEAAALAPVRGKDRIAVLDALRGIAILAIFYLNLPFMAGPIAASLGDVRTMGWSPLDSQVWLFMKTFLEGTQRGLLEMLFGAGLMVTAAKAMELDGPVGVADLYIRRNLWLLAFGLLDIFVLLWPGDILHTYALCALALFPFRRLRVRWLLVIGLVFAMLQMVVGVAEYFERTQTQLTYQVAIAKEAKGTKLSADEAKVVKKWRESEARIKGTDPETQKLNSDETKARAGSMGDFAGFMISTYLWIVGKGGLVFGVIEAFTTMLIGIALWKLGFIQGRWTNREYWIALAVGYGFGLTARYVGALELLTFAPGPKTIWATGELARLAVTCGHIAAINLLMRARFGRKLMQPFVAAGTVAFTLYLLQQIIGLWFLYSPIGLHLPSAPGWAYLAWQASVVIVLQLIAANLWTRWFVSGPFEWVWRSLAYCRKQPFRRASAVSP